MAVSPTATQADRPGVHPTHLLLWRGLLRHGASICQQGLAGEVESAKCCRPTRWAFCGMPIRGWAMGRPSCWTRGMEEDGRLTIPPIGAMPGAAAPGAAPPGAPPPIAAQSQPGGSVRCYGKWLPHPG